MDNPLHAVIDILGWESKKNVISKLNKIYSRLGKKNRKVTMCKKLGNGAYGSVFQINDKTALKISEDRTEINTMAIVKKHPTVNIVKVWDVFRCRIANRIYYFIVEELLSKARGDWRDFADFVMAPVDDCCITKKSIKRAKQKPATELEHIKQLPCQWKWIEQIAAYFDKHKIKFVDIHNGNIMRRKNRHVLIDLGVARAPRQVVDLL